MDWHGLGHAMWLAEAAGLRLLFDPLLGETHHGGGFEVRPRRTVNAEALRADFIFVSHRHGDHFDVPSLRRLAALDPDSVVLTPDRLVVWAAERLGFRTVHRLPVGQRLELDGVRLVTTPSVSPLEWGALVEADGALVWNQVDSVPRDAAHLVSFMGVALAALDRPPHHRIDLGLVAWQPLLEIEALTGGSTTFPRRRYGQLLEQIARLAPRFAVPSAAGGRHVGPGAWLERHVQPVPEARFLRDLSRRAPHIRGLPSRVGGLYRVEPGAVTLEEGPGLVERHEDDAPRCYDPLAIPALVDPEIGRAPLDAMRARVSSWLEETLAPALAEAYRSMNFEGPLQLALEVVWPSVSEATTFVVSSEGCALRSELALDWDVLDRVAGSALYEVIEGRMQWGDVLLAGLLRAVSRAYDVDETGLTRANVGLTFLYYGLSYDDSTERAIRWEVEAELARGSG